MRPSFAVGEVISEEEEEGNFGVGVQPDEEEIPLVQEEAKSDVQEPVKVEARPINESIQWEKPSFQSDPSTDIKYESNNLYDSQVKIDAEAKLSWKIPRSQDKE